MQKDDEMNALDLADRLEEFYSGTHITKAAETIRQQFAELQAYQDAEMRYLRAIRKLKDDNKELHGINYELEKGESPKNKPVAIASCDEMGIQGFSLLRQIPFGIHCLYIRPPCRELSREEIEQVADETDLTHALNKDWMFEFARAILKKASKK